MIYHILNAVIYIKNIIYIVTQKLTQTWNYTSVSWNNTYPQVVILFHFQWINMLVVTHIINLIITEEF